MPSKRVVLEARVIIRKRLFQIIFYIGIGTIIYDVIYRIEPIRSEGPKFMREMDWNLKLRFWKYNEECYESIVQSELLNKKRLVAPKH